ncbi:DUF4912 domain-containing protein [Desmospora profundinema]|uniref:DUF4912 domain-containing protein n=1 Tax=Desmospora profundinema TaxID=1571184 RepID=A0ABU1IKT3_9BACL|nr:DUF4912 domain-containing protein [Desmospora profundinema]MDR6224754.1 hypothetical protein [Desmospora profundinema]
MDDYSIWTHVQKRLEAGESHRQVAASLDMTLGQFRYRLRKYREAGEQEVAATREEIDLERPEWREISRLWDEEWEQRGPEDRLVLMVKDPWTLFAHWHLSRSQKEQVSRHFEASWDQLPFSLRLMDVTDLQVDGEQAHCFRVEDTHPSANRFWLPQVKPGRHYLADWGTWTVEGNFFTLLRSNMAETPPQPENRKSLPLKMERAAAFSQVSTTEPGEPYYPEIREGWAERFDGYTWVERKEGNR